MSTPERQQQQQTQKTARFTPKSHTPQGRIPRSPDPRFTKPKQPTQRKRPGDPAQPLNKIAEGFTQAKTQNPTAAAANAADHLVH
jgi:hypothetical protein